MIDLKKEAQDMCDAAQVISKSLWEVSGLADSNEQRTACAACVVELAELGDTIEKALALLERGS